MPGARNGRGRPNRAVLLRAPLAEEPPPIVTFTRRPISVSTPRRSFRSSSRATLIRAPLAGTSPITSMASFRFSDLGPKWSFEMMTLRVSSENKAKIQVAVTADADGLPYDPTSAIAEMAFMVSPHAKPSSGDWKACSWDVTRIGTFVMQCLVGPGGTVELPVGGYYWWAKLTDAASGEIPVEQLGRLFVD